MPPKNQTWRELWVAGISPLKAMELLIHDPSNYPSNIIVYYPVDIHIFIYIYNPINPINYHNPMNYRILSIYSSRIRIFQAPRPPARAQARAAPRPW